MHLRPSRCGCRRRLWKTRRSPEREEITWRRGEQRGNERKSCWEVRHSVGKIFTEFTSHKLKAKSQREGGKVYVKPGKGRPGRSSNVLGDNSISADSWILPLSFFTSWAVSKDSKLVSSTKDQVGVIWPVFYK